MSDYSQKLKRLLRKNGCSFHRQGKGDHEIWYSPLSNCYFTVDGAIKSRHTANKTLQDAGLDKQF
ncbi:MAG: type II toxin-antitoxin system HicA family toxin [Gammaproteobacteria bacterium]